MMMTKIIKFFCLFSVSLLFAVSAFAQNDDIDPVQLFRQGDNVYFLRQGPVIKYPEAQGYVNDIPEKNVLHQSYVKNFNLTDVLTSMVPSAHQVKSGSKWLSFDDLVGNDFHFDIHIRQKENLPDGAGGTCWIRLSNKLMKGINNASGIILYPGEKAYSFSSNDGKTEYHEIADLSNLDVVNSKIRFDFIRLDGTTYVYAGRKFVFAYEDGLGRVLSFDAGSELFQNGNRVRCEFSDIGMRIR